MAFTITNKSSIPTDFMSVENSTTNMQVNSTATSTGLGAQQHWEFSDYTTTGPIPRQGQQVTGSIGDFGAPYRSWKAFVYFKSLVEGTNTSSGAIAGPLVCLEVATSTAIFVGSGSTGTSIGAIVVASQMLFGTGATSTGNTQTMMLTGMTPTVAGAQYARINFYPTTSATTLFSGTSSTAIDAFIEAA
jgi:hypothetical protein